MDRNVSTQSHIVLNENNWLEYAMKNYSNPHLSSVSEFEEDLKRLSSILLLLNKYKKNNRDLNLNLLINHIIVLSNVFGTVPAKNLILYKIDNHHRASIRTILYFLKIFGTLELENIDSYILEKLKEL